MMNRLGTSEVRDTHLAKACLPELWPLNCVFVWCFDFLATAKYIYQSVDVLASAVPFWERILFA